MSILQTWINFWLILVFNLPNASGNEMIVKLFERLMVDYNRSVRPVHNASDKLVVHLGASLCRLLDVDEVNQVLTTSLWLEMQWRDKKLTWDPKEWDGVQYLDIPSDQLWVPDIVLYNNADGEPHITITNMARVDYTGLIVWQPPSIYKSFCQIDIQNFPYDEQTCKLKFGGWTNDGGKVIVYQIPVNENDVPEARTELSESGEVIDFLFLEDGLGLGFYHESAEWDLLSATSSRNIKVYPGCCGNQYYIDITYIILIRRKAIFFTVTLTIPCMLIANLTPFVFVILPNEHKMTYSISVLVAFSVFYLVLIDIIPPTSTNMSLIGCYLLFTLFMVSISCILSVITINMYRKQAFASEMTSWQRWLFIQKLPPLLRLKPLEDSLDDDGSDATTTRTGSVSNTASLGAKPSIPNNNNNSPIFPPQRLRLLSLVQMDEALKQRCAADNLDLFKKIAGHLSIISAHFQNQQMESKITDEWQLMSLVIDRIFLIIYLIINIGADIWFIYSAPTLFDSRPSLVRTLPSKPLSGSFTIFQSNHSIN